MRGRILLGIIGSFAAGVIITFSIGFILQNLEREQQQVSSTEYTEEREQDESFPGYFIEVPNYFQSVGCPIKFWCVGNWCTEKFFVWGVLGNIIIWGIIVFTFLYYSFLRNKAPI